MPQRSGVGPQIYEIGGAGVVLWMPSGSTFPADEADAVDYNTVSWDASVTETDQDVTNTSDFNEDTNLMNQRSLTTARRIRGTANYHFNADPTKDLLLNYLTAAIVYPALVLFITRGNLAGTGIPATNRCYLLLPEVKLGEIAIQGADPTAVRGVSIPFMSNGLWSYVSEAVPVGP